jgi:membrane-bound lytic murein transglycosylase B
MRISILTFTALTALSCIGVGGGVSPARADAAGFPAWLENFKSAARADGISDSVIAAALGPAQFIPRVIDLDRKQPEKTRTFNEYKKGVVSKQRIDQGRRLMTEYRDILQKVSHDYGVPASTIVALWGIETNFGKNTGGFRVVDALATLAYEGRRATYFQKELLNALHIIQDGHIAADAMKGSWAGAMGQNQFMPTSFKLYAVDYNGDNLRDIWGKQADVFASTANYLAQNGWKMDERWGRAVRLPIDFDTSYIGLEQKASVNTWAARGITMPNGSALPQSDMMGSIVRPQDSGREAYLVYGNYRAIMHWNRSTYFATSVGLLSDAIAGGGR